MILTYTIIGANKTKNISNKYNSKQNKYWNFLYYSIRETFAFFGILRDGKSIGSLNSH